MTRGVGDGAGVVPAVLQGEAGDGHRAAEVVQAADQGVGCIPEVIEGRVSPVEGEGQVSFRGLAGDPRPAADGEVVPELEGDNAGRCDCSPVISASKKVHPKVRNHGEGPYYRAFSWLKAPRH